MFLKFHEDSEEKRQVFGQRKQKKQGEKKAQRQCGQHRVLQRPAANRTKARASGTSNDSKC